MSDSKDEKKFRWQWSGKHTRLRYQMVAGALLFATFCRFEAVEFHLPFSVAKFEGMPHQVEFILGSLGFYVFTTWAFIVQSGNERHALDVKESQVVKRTDQIISRLTSFTEATTNLGVRANEEMLGHLKSIEEANRSIEIGLLDAKAMVPELTKAADKLRQLVEENLTKFRTISGGADSIIMVDGFDDAHRSRNLIEQLHKFYQSSTHKELELYLNEFTDLLSMVDSFASTTPYKLEELEPSLLKTIKAAKGFTEAEIERIETIKNSLETQSFRELQALEKEIRKLNTDALKRLKFNTIEREWLGFKAPLIVGVLLILTGVVFWIG